MVFTCSDVEIFFKNSADSIRPNSAEKFGILDDTQSKLFNSFLHIGYESYFERMLLENIGKYLEKINTFFANIINSKMIC